LRLVESLGKLYSKLLNRTIDPLDEILITVGADGSLFNAFTSFLNRSPDDEVIIIEPFYDAYVNLSVISNANKIKFVPLRPRVSSSSSRDWCWDENELENAFTHNTRLLVVNNPNNPLGKVYSREELEKLASLCLKYNVLCISDEVYEHIVYEKQHIRIATLPSMWQRTVTIGSAGKTFSSTGVKVNKINE
jgi:kynurenine--oxoglutarate transaminase/cysteine-S-conjugate beta-lyase/glutamine--phenylpyruvate transaminase